jgi:hypothetical protein
VHACADQVRAGQIDEHDAPRILTTSVRDLFTGTSPRNPARQDTEPATGQAAADGITGNH